MARPLVSFVGLIEDDIYQWALKGGLSGDDAREVAHVGMLSATEFGPHVDRFHQLWWQAERGHH
jgi:hypothetical protein